MGTKQSKQEKRLAKGLAQQKAKPELTPQEVAEVDAALAPFIAPTAEEIAEEVEAGNDGGGELLELPELVPDVANPEGVPPQEQVEPPYAEATAADLGNIAVDPPAPTPTPPAAGPVLHVKTGLTLRGGRGEWYKLLCKYDGKPVAEYIAAGKANPASHYTARSTKCGQPKTPESRLSWFKRAGIVTIK